MKVISIDVGIKNLAFCLLEYSSDKKYEIIKWDVINLSQKIDSKCSELDKTGLPCNNPVKFAKNTKCYCLKHSKKMEFQIPTPQLKSSFINKQKIQGLYDIANKYKISYTTPIKKADLISIINEYIHKICFEPIENINASKMDLVTIGRNIQFKLDDLLKNDLETIDTVIIENQISPIANRMKTIQGMIAQYFIMKNNNIKIEFVNAANKLKILEDNKNVIKNNSKTTTYSERKKQGVNKTLELLHNNILLDVNNEKWEIYFESHKKKDDLADSLLQGIWYIYL